MKYCARFVLLAAGLAVGAPAFAQDAVRTPPIATAAPKAKAKKPAEKPTAGPRRPGELEGWSRSEGAARPKSAVREQSPPDGGLPLPTTRQTTTEPGVGFDRSGNFSTGLKF
mgnify:CR=1 FL=1